MLRQGHIVGKKYIIRDFIGAGAAGKVYLASDCRGICDFAIKEVNLNSSMGESIVKESLILEVNILKSLKHRSIARVVDVVKENDSIFMITELAKGMNLAQILKSGGVFRQERVINIALQICDVLGYLHSRDCPVIYRDLNPSNIILTPGGKIILIDFGAVFMSSKQFPVMKNAFGTAVYAAPEQYDNISCIDERVDVYAFGRTLSVLLNGKDPAVDSKSSISSELEILIKNCTAYDKKKRYPSMAEVYYYLRNMKELGFKWRMLQASRLLIFFITLCIGFLGLAGFSYTSDMTGASLILFRRIFFIAASVGVYFLFDVKNVLYTLSGIKKKSEIERMNGNSARNGAFLISGNFRTECAESFDDVEIPLDEPVTDLRIDMDSGFVNFAGMENFKLEKDIVITRYDNYKLLN